MSYQSVVEGDSPWGYWQLGEASGTNAADSSGNSRNGTYTNSPTLGVTGPVSGTTAATFAAASSQYVAPPSTIFNQAHATVEAWINVSAVPTSARLIAGCVNGLNNSTADKLLYIGTDGKLYFYAFDGAAKTTSAPTATVPTNQWVYVVGTADGTNLKLYVNASLAGSVAAGNTYTGYTVSNVYIAADSSTASPSNTGGGILFFNGSIGQVAFYSVALTSTQITNHYNAATGGGGGAGPFLPVPQLMTMGVGRSDFKRARAGDLWLPERFVR